MVACEAKRRAVGMAALGRDGRPQGKMRQPTAVLSRNMERRWRTRASRYLREISPNDSCASMLETGPGLSAEDVFRLCSRFSRAAGRIFSSRRRIEATVTE